MSNPSERARVQALVDAGSITQDEADILFAALEDEAPQQREEGLEVAEARGDRTVDSPMADDLAADASAVKIQPPRVPTPPEPLPPAAALPPEPPEAPPHHADAATDARTTWVKLSGFCGDLSVRGDPTLTSPVVTGYATVERSDAGYLIRTPPDHKGGGGNWLSRLHKAAGNVEVRLPAGMGLDLAIAAGDGEVRGVRALKGSFTGGDFEVEGADTLDLNVTAGDIALALCPRSGSQRLRAISGDFTLSFAPGSSAEVSGSATCGDLTLPQTFSRSGSFASQRFEGTLGAGDARLELRLTAGDVTVRAADA